MRERAHTAAAAAAACALLLTAVLYAVMVGTPDGRRMELLSRFSGAWRHDMVRHAGDALLHAVVPVAVAAAVLVTVWTARNRRRREGWAALALLAIANVSAQIVKLVLPWLDPTGGEALRVTSGAFPSGHATLAASAALAVLIVAPPRARRAVGAVGAAFVAAVDVSLLALGWHFPSDIVAGGLIALAAAVVVRPAWARPSARAALGGLLVVAAVALLISAALAGTRLQRDGALAAGAIAAAGVALGTILAASTTPRLAGVRGRRPGWRSGHRPVPEGDPEPVGGVGVQRRQKVVSTPGGRGCLVQTQSLPEPRGPEHRRTET